MDILQEIEGLLNAAIKRYGYRVVSCPQYEEEKRLIFGIGCDRYNAEKANRVEISLQSLFPSGVYKDKYIVIRIGRNAVASKP